MKLTDPYPSCPGIKNSLIIALLISLFIVAFLAFFQPFELNQIHSKNKIWFIGGFGVVNFLILTLNMILIPKIIPSFFKEMSWKVYKELLWICWLLFTIGIGNFLYAKLLFDFPESYLQGFLGFQLYTLAVGIFPTIVIVAINYNQQLRRNLEAASQMNTALKDHNVAALHNEQEILISNENQKEILQLPINDVLYIQSEGNYISIYYKRDQDIKRSMIRNTLKKTENELEQYFPPLFKTHRSFIVNLNLVDKIRGNSQGLQLYLPELEEFVPVSRAYINKFRDALKSIKI